MKKCAIIIETSEGKLIVSVDNFSKDNVVNALSKIIGVDADKIEQVSASVSYGIYGIKEPFLSAKRLHVSTVRFSSNEFDTYFVVDYGFFAD